VNVFSAVIQEFKGKREQKDLRYESWREQRAEEAQALAKEIDLLMDRRRFRKQRALEQSL
jgi:hypothetical protein